MNIKQYRIFDIMVLTLIGFILNFINFAAIGKFELLTFTLDIVIVVVLITMFRWNFYGIITSVVLTLAKLILFVDYSFTVYFVTILTSICIGVVPLWFKVIPKDKTTNNSFIMLAFVIFTYAVILSANSIGTLFVGESAIDYIKAFPFVEGFNIVIVFAIMVIASKQDALLVDMETYLSRNIRRGETNDK